MHEYLAVWNSLGKHLKSFNLALKYHMAYGSLFRDQWTVLCSCWLETCTCLFTEMLSLFCSAFVLWNGYMWMLNCYQMEVKFMSKPNDTIGISNISINKEQTHTYLKDLIFAFRSNFIYRQKWKDCTFIIEWIELKISFKVYSS